MSKIAIAGATTGTGTFTLASPATNTDRTLTLPDEAGTVLTTAGVPASAMPAGSVLQVVSTTKTDTFSASMASGAVTDITGLAASITPTSTSSKILVMVDVSATHNAGGSGFVVTRGGTPISVGDAGGSRTRISFGGATTDDASAENHIVNNSAQILDEPATASSVTYQVQIYNSRVSTQTHYVNQSALDPNNSYSPRTASRITLMEIAG